MRSGTVGETVGRGTVGGWLAAGGLETLAFGGFGLLAPVFVVLISRGLVPLLVAVAALVLLSRLLRGRLVLPGWDLSLALALPLAWVLFSCLLSPEPPVALNAAVRLALLLWGGVFLVAQAGALSPAQRRPLPACLLAGFGLGLAALLAEALDGRALLSLLFEVEQGSHQPLSMLNRGATGLALFVWPAALLLWRAGAGWRGPALLLPLAFGLLSLFYESAAATAAVAFGLLVAGLAAWRPRLGRALLLIVSLGVLFAMPLVASGLDRLGVGAADELPNSARHRVHVWSYAAEQFAEKPLFGWGFDASRFVPDAPVEVAPGLTMESMPLHPHNAGLQILLELGLLGALLAAGFVYTLLRRLRGHGAVAAAEQGLYAAALVIAATAFGLWQNRWIAVLVGAALLLQLARHAPEGRRRERGGA